MAEYLKLLQFFSAGIKIIVKAENKSRRYGQENPAFDRKCFGSDRDRHIRHQSNKSYSGDLKLDNLVFATNAMPLSSPRSYGISVARTMPLDNDDSLLRNIHFNSWRHIDRRKNDFKNYAKQKTIKYGDDLTGITYTYELDQNGVVSPQFA